MNVVMVISIKFLPFPPPPPPPSFLFNNWQSFLLLHFHWIIVQVIQIISESGTRPVVHSASWRSAIFVVQVGLVDFSECFLLSLCFLDFGLQSCLTGGVASVLPGSCLFWLLSGLAVILIFGVLLLFEPWCSGSDGTTVDLPSAWRPPCTAFPALGTTGLPDWTLCSFPPDRLLTDLYVAVNCLIYSCNSICNRSGVGPPLKQRPRSSTWCQHRSVNSFN